jgi:hypothetical protein
VGVYGADPLARARPFIVRGAFVSLILALATAATVWAGSRALLKGSGVLAVLAVLVGVDALRLDGAFITTLDFRSWSAPDPNVEFLLSRQEVEPPFRVADLNLGGQSVQPAIHGLELAAGHHPNDLARYRELIGMRGSGAPENLFQPNVYRLLNVRYLIWPAQMGDVPGLEPVSQTQLGGVPYESVYALGGLPRARLVGEARVVPEERMVEAILDPAFDPGLTALLTEEPPIALAGGPVEGEVTWEERGTNAQRLRVRAEAPALLVLADNWFPSWHARVDGEEAPLLRAYHTLRAVPVEAGEHTVELYYRSGTLRWSLALSLATFVLLAGAGALSWWRSRGGDAPRVRG